MMGSRLSPPRLEALGCRIRRLVVARARLCLRVQVVRGSASRVHPLVASTPPWRADRLARLWRVHTGRVVLHDVPGGGGGGGGVGGA